MTDEEKLSRKLFICGGILALLSLVSLYLSYNTFTSPAWLADFDHFFENPNLNMRLGLSIEFLRLLIYLIITYILIFGLYESWMEPKDYRLSTRLGIAFKGKSKGPMALLFIFVLCVLVHYHVNSAPITLKERWQGTSHYTREDYTNTCPKSIPKVSSKKESDLRKEIKSLEDLYNLVVLNKSHLWVGLDYRFTEDFKDDDFQMYYLPYYIYFTYSFINFNILAVFITGLSFVFFSLRHKSYKDAKQNFENLLISIKDGKSATKALFVISEAKNVTEDITIKFSWLFFVWSFAIFYELILGCKTLANAALYISYIGFVAALSCLIIPFLCYFSYHNFIIKMKSKTNKLKATCDNLSLKEWNQYNEEFKTLNLETIHFPYMVVVRFFASSLLILVGNFHNPQNVVSILKSLF